MSLDKEKPISNAVEEAESGKLKKLESIAVEAIQKQHKEIKMPVNIPNLADKYPKAATEFKNAANSSKKTTETDTKEVNEKRLDAETKTIEKPKVEQIDSSNFATPKIDQQRTPTMELGNFGKFTKVPTLGGKFGDAYKMAKSMYGDDAEGGLFKRNDKIYIIHDKNNPNKPKQKDLTDILATKNMEENPEEGNERRLTVDVNKIESKMNNDDIYKTIIKPSVDQYEQKRLAAAQTNKVLEPTDRDEQI